MNLVLRRHGYKIQPDPFLVKALQFIHYHLLVEFLISLFIMRLIISLTALVTTAIAVPAAHNADIADRALRLIKTSASDEGIWVTEGEKISKYTAKKIDFVDITDIKDTEVLQRLSASPSDNFRVAAITYPTTLTHQTEANGLIAKTNTNGPKSWLTTLTK